MGDARGWRMALVPDTLVNPPREVRTVQPQVLRILVAQGYGVLQLPPPGEHGLLLAVIADQLAEYAHHGYAIAAVGVHDQPGRGLHWRRLAPLMRHRGMPPPPRHIVRLDRDAELEAQRLTAFLASYDLPVEEQRRWRGGATE
jgi:hypothetical protein